MNPLFKLWFLVLLVSVLLGIVFYLADHYPYIIGNFYVLLSVFLITYSLYYFVPWVLARKRKRNFWKGK